MEGLTGVPGFGIMDSFESRPGVDAEAARLFFGTIKAHLFAWKANTDTMNKPTNPVN